MCTHELFGFSKKGWRLESSAMVGVTGEVVAQDYTCTCKEGKRGRIAVEFPADKDWFEKEGKFCRFCGKELLPAMNRVWFLKCASCGLEVPYPTK